MDGWIDGWTDLEGLPTDREKKVAEEETCGEMLGEGRKLQSGQIIEWINEWLFHFKAPLFEI